MKDLYHQQIIDLTVAFHESLKPPPDLNVWQWADKYRVLTSEASAEPGPWRTERFPFVKEIMYEMSPQSSAQVVVIMKGSQVAITECYLNLQGYTIHFDPKPMLYMQKTVDAVKRYSMQRFKKSLENTPEIAAKLPSTKSRDDSNTIFMKNFPGGLLILGGANSAASLRSMPIAILMPDEVDSFELDIDEEGDPAELAEVRTNNFPNRKIIYGSSPKVKETSRIEPLFLDGQQRYYYVPCPYCGYEQTIKWGNIKYETVRDHELVPDSVKLKCEKCGQLIPERFKTQMLARGRWKAKYPKREVVSFHVNALYSPIGFFSWDMAVKRWLKYRRTRNKELLRVFVNTVLGETFSETDKQVDYSSLSSHKSIYKAEVPDGVLMLTAGADVQEGRIEVETIGWGMEEENWSIDYTRFMGDPERDFIWGQLFDYLTKGWKTTKGGLFYPVCSAIDSGYKTRKVYTFCRGRETYRIYPVKGLAGWGKGLINRPTKRNQDGVMLFMAYVDELKSKIYSQLTVDKPGPGYCHFPSTHIYDDSYFQMLTAEKLRRKRVSGQYKLVWELPPGACNEALDCRAYAIAALNILNPNFEAAAKRREEGTEEKPKRKLKRRRVLSKGL